MADEQLEGKVGGGHVDVTEQGVRLPKIRARKVKLENWSLMPDLQTANTVDAVWGYYNQFLHWLNAGGNTDDLLVPEQDLSNIVLRTKAGQTVTIFYSWKL